MATQLEEQSASNKKRVGKGITDALKDIAPHIEKLEMQIEATRDLPFQTPKQKQKLQVRLEKLVNDFLSVWKEQLGATVQQHYKRSLNKDVQGAKDMFGEAVQKRKFKKKENIKELDLTFIFENMTKVVKSIVEVELEYHRRKLATNILFAKEVN